MKHNVFSQNVNVTEVPLQLFQIVQPDIYKHALIFVGKIIIPRCLPQFLYQNYAILDIQNKCPYGSCRGGSRTLAISKMEIFVIVVKCPVNNYVTKSTVLDLAGILHPCIVNVPLTLEVLVPLYTVALYHLE